MTISNKVERLKAIGLKRKTSVYDGYYNLDHFHSGRYESDYVSPYSKSSGNVDSPIVILLQDWSSYENLAKDFNSEIAQLGYNPKLQTNKNLQILLSNVFALEISDVFVTNVFPFIKGGNMSANIPVKDINRAFSDFCIPQINIILPKLVICCGSKVYGSAINHFGKEKKKKYNVNESFSVAKMIFCHQRHPGATATNTNGGIGVAIKNWQIMKTNFYR